VNRTFLLMVNKYTKVMESSNPSATFLELPVIDTYHQKTNSIDALGFKHISFHKHFNNSSQSRSAERRKLGGPIDFVVNGFPSKNRSTWMDGENADTIDRS